MSLVASNVHISFMSLFCLLWKICVSSANDHILQSFKVSLWWKNKFLSVSWTVVGRFQTGNNDAFFNFDLHNSRLNEKRIIIPRKNVGLWLKFTLFESYKNILIPISLMPPLVAFFSINSCNWSYCKFFRKNRSWFDKYQISSDKNTCPTST